MMKFSNYFLSLAMLASLFMLASCNDDDEIGGGGIDQTSFVIQGTDDVRETSLRAGETIAFDVVVNVPTGLNNLVVNQTIDGNTVVYDRFDRDPGVPITETTYAFSYSPEAGLAGEQVIFDFVVVDDEGDQTSYEYIVDVMAAEVIPYSTVLLAAPTLSGENEVWFSSSLGERYATSEVNATSETLSAEIDFGYRYGPNAGATLASPAAYPSEGEQNISGWAAQRETMLRRTQLSDDQFMEQGESAQFIIDAFEEGSEGTNPQRLTGLQEGEVLAFMTDPAKEGGSKYGLIHVVEIDMGSDGTGYGSDAAVTLNVKVIE